MTPVSGLYATQHASAARVLARKGAPVTFTRGSLGIYDPTTDTSFASTVTTIPGSAVRVRGNPDTYRALGLIESSAPTLLFTPTNYGDLPNLGDTLSWGGLVHTVKDVAPIAPDGVAIACRVVVTR